MTVLVVNAINPISVVTMLLRISIGDILSLNDRL